MCGILWKCLFQALIGKTQTTKNTKKGPYQQNKNAYHTTKKDVQVCLEREEVMWRQKSKVLWLKEWDLTSKHLYTKASQRRRRKLITKLRENYGE